MVVKLKHFVLLPILFFLLHSVLLNSQRQGCTALSLGINSVLKSRFRHAQASGAAFRSLSANSGDGSTGYTSPSLTTAAVIGIPRESQSKERRVAACPSQVSAYLRAGYHVAVARNAGLLAGYTDQDYRDAGAVVVPELVAWKADVVLKVQPPSAYEASLLQNRTIVSLLYPAAAEKTTTTTTTSTSTTSTPTASSSSKINCSPTLEALLRLERQGATAYALDVGGTTMYGQSQVVGSAALKEAVSLFRNINPDLFIDTSQEQEQDGERLEEKEEEKEEEEEEEMKEGKRRQRKPSLFARLFGSRSSSSSISDSSDSSSVNYYDQQTIPSALQLLRRQRDTEMLRRLRKLNVVIFGTGPTAMAAANAAIALRFQSSLLTEAQPDTINVRLVDFAGPQGLVPTSIPEGCSFTTLGEAPAFPSSSSSSSSLSQQQQTLVSILVSEADVVVCALPAAAPSQPVPVVLTQQSVQHMKEGAVIVDTTASATNPANCAVTVADRIVTARLPHLLSKSGEIPASAVSISDVKKTRRKGVTVIGYTDFPSRAAKRASAAFADSALPVVLGAAHEAQQQQQQRKAYEKYPQPLIGRREERSPVLKSCLVLESGQRFNFNHFNRFTADDEDCYPQSAATAVSTSDSKSDNSGPAYEQQLSSNAIGGKPVAYNSRQSIPATTTAATAILGLPASFSYNTDDYPKAGAKAGSGASSSPSFLERWQEWQGDLSLVGTAAGLSWKGLFGGVLGGWGWGGEPVVARPGR